MNAAEFQRKRHAIREDIRRLSLAAADLTTRYCEEHRVVPDGTAIRFSHRGETLTGTLCGVWLHDANDSAEVVQGVRVTLPGERFMTTEWRTGTWVEILDEAAE